MQVKTKHYVLGGILAVIIGAAFLFTANWVKSPLAASQMKPKPVKAAEIDVKTFKNIALNLKDKDTKEFFQTAEKESLKLELKTQNTYQVKREFSQVVTPEFEFTAVAPHWLTNLPKTTNIKLSIRINDGKNWESWQDITTVDAVKENSKKNPFKQGELVFAENKGKFFEYKVELTSADSKVTPALEEIKFYYLDASEGPNPLAPKKLFGIIPVASAGTGNHFSRQDWGAEESYRYQNGKEEWSRRYASVKSFVIHHTAGANNPSNPAATVRGIYYYHAVTLDWGDIGYNFLVDQNGNTYEGRFGGKNVVAGHASNYNYGTCGISVLGNFETASPTSETLNGLAALINKKTDDDSFHSHGSVTLTKTSGYPNYSYLGTKTVRTICSHRDLMSTACPGKNLYAKLERIRDIVESNQIPAYNYEVVSTSYPPATMEAGTTFKVVVKIKNTGRMTWYNSGDARNHAIAALAPSHPQYRESSFGLTRTRMLESQVDTGDTATFEMNITAPKTSGGYTEYLQPVIEGRTWLKDQSINFKVSVPREDYHYQIISKQYPTTVRPRGTYTVYLKVRNGGSKTWQNSGTKKISLGTYDPTDRQSNLSVTESGSGWSSTKRVKLIESSVSSVATGTFKFKIQIPWNMTSGNHTETFRMVAENTCWFGPRIQLNMSVQPVTNYSVTSLQKPPSRMIKKTTARVTIKIKNTGNTTWYQKKGSGKLGLLLAASHPKYRRSAFGPKRVRMQESQVKPGETATFTFTVKAPNKKKTYREYFQPILEGKNWLKYKGISFKTKVENRSYQYSVVSIKRPPALMSKGSKSQVIVKIKNKSNFNWHNNGLNPVKLRIRSKSTSSFANQSWDNLSSVTMDQAVVGRGQTASFTFTITAPNRPGKYTERFAPLLEGKKSFPYKGIAFKTQVPGSTVTVGITQGGSSQNPSGNIKVTGNGSYLITDSAGNQIKSGDGGTVSSVGIRDGVYYVYYNNNLIEKTTHYIIFTPVNNTILSAPSYTGVGYSVNGDRSFRGNLIIRYSSYSDQYYHSGLWLINQLDVEDYLKGLAEQSDSSGSETLKLMAVVARTYAIYNISNPKTICANRHFQLFNNAYSQVYKGYEFERRASHLSDAVGATRGIIIAYQGKPIVAAFHSRCGGHTESLAGFSYLHGKSCSPHRCSGSRLGHGWGMCMYGARNKIAAGKSWREVIHFYYTSVSIKDLY